MFGNFWYFLCIFGTSLPAVVRTVLLLYFFWAFCFLVFLGHFFLVFKDFFDVSFKSFFANFYQFQAFFVVVCFGPTMEFFSCAFGHFLAFLGTCQINFLLHFLGTFLNFSGMFNSFWNFLGPFLVCRLFLTIFATFFCTIIWLFFLVILKTLYQFLPLFKHSFAFVGLFFSTFGHHLKPFDTFLAPITNHFEQWRQVLTHFDSFGLIPTKLIFKSIGAIYGYFDVFGSFGSYSEPFGAV